MARERTILADFAKPEMSRSKASYQQFTNDILGKLSRGTFVLPYQEMEYMVMNEDAQGSGAAFLMLVEKGFYHPHAFRCLERMNTEFGKFFVAEQVEAAKYLSLSREFEGALGRVYEEFARNTNDKAAIAISQMKSLNGNLSSTMENLIDRDNKLDDMMRKTSEMSDLSYSISRKSRKVHRNAFWSSIFAKLLYLAIGLVLLYLLLYFLCGGPTLAKCR